MSHMPALEIPDGTTAVSTGRTIATTAPLSGGGDLSTNRTLSIATFGAAQAGVVPASGGGTNNFLRADGSWAEPAGGGASVAAFSYTVTGAEADRSELTIPLPSSRSDTNYSITPSQETATYLLGMRVTSKTTSNFVLSLSANATAGDVFKFVLAEDA